MTMHWIASSTSTTQFSFDNIPQTFSHLHIRYFNPTSSNNGGWFMRFNSVNATEYAGAYWGGTTSSNGPQFSMTDILDYSSTTKHKHMRTFYGNDINTSGIIVMGGGAWRSLNALTSILFIPAVTFAAGSRVDLYGITTNPIATGA